MAFYTRVKEALAQCEVHAAILNHGACVVINDMINMVYVMSDDHDSFGKARTTAARLQDS
jgi:hypothetical protein